MRESLRPPPWRWFHGALFYGLVQGATYGVFRLANLARGPQTVKPGDVQRYYRGEYRPVFSPPPWAFAPAWTIHNVAAIWGLLRALNLPRSKDRDAYLALQGLSWLDFVLFSGASFGLRSHVNGLVLTLAYLTLTLLSLYVALARLRDGQLALSLSTLTAWLVIAAGVSLGTTLWNRDDLYDAGPFATPPEGWAKWGA
jgi:tryptophan-rich sensory protein